LIYWKLIGPTCNSHIYKLALAVIL